MAHDFSTLAPADFEDLTREILGREFALRFEAFAAGPDGGIDGRHAKGPDAIILQAKHRRGSTFASLKSTMARERPAIDRLSPARYILATSRPLTPANKQTLATVIGPCLRTEADIFGPDDLNQLLRKFPDIEKAHVKLWLSSTAMLEKVLHAAQHAFAAITREEIEAKVRVYAQNPSFQESKTKLDTLHVLIISGPPGVGKTTLAEMLSYAYVGDGWELIPIRTLDDAFAHIDDAKKRVYYFDDFLGRISLDQKALALRETDLSRFIKRIRSSPNARFILTTRAYIYEEARRSSETLSDTRLDLSRYVLDVGKYTRRIKARILYNHLVVAGTPPLHIQSLIDADALKKIVDHPSYNPRVIQWMTEAMHVNEILPENYAKAFVDALDHPHQLWDTAFRHLPQKCQHLLFTLFFSSEYGIEIALLRTAFETIHSHLSTTYGVPRGPKDFEEALRILESGFVQIRAQSVSFVNPSIRDYLSSYLQDIRMLLTFAEVCPSAGWSLHVWQHGRKSLQPEDHKRLAFAFAPIAPALLSHPVEARMPGPPIAYHTVDISLTRRIELLIEWFAETEDEAFLDIAIELTTRPAFDFSSWHDAENLVSLAQEINYPIMMDEAPKLAELREHAANLLIQLLDNGMASDDLETIADSVAASTKWLTTPEIELAVQRAIVREFDDVRQSISDIDSESTLEDHGRTLEKLAPRAHIPPAVLARALETVRDRIDVIADRVSTSRSPPVTGTTTAHNDVFDDTALLNLFEPLTTPAEH